MTHWKSKVDLRYSLDTVSYSMGRGHLPGLFLEYNERDEQVYHSFYSIFHTEVGAPRVADHHAELYVD